MSVAADIVHCIITRSVMPTRRCYVAAAYFHCRYRCHYFHAYCYVIDADTDIFSPLMPPLMLMLLPPCHVSLLSVVDAISHYAAAIFDYFFFFFFFHASAAISIHDDEPYCVFAAVAAVDIAAARCCYYVLMMLLRHDAITIVLMLLSMPRNCWLICALSSHGLFRC